ncbi:MAG: hypothetical protein PUP92_17335 [Rhizonema sp. PD38]|nr:hypothetical protein [Rhizonema sp. PD38]
MLETQPAEAKATIRIHGQEIENFEVPIDILVRVLAGLQQIVYLLATVIEKRSVGQRFRVPMEMQQLYSLRVGVPQLGSFAIPIVLKPEIDSQTSIFSGYTELMLNLERFFSSLNSFDFNQAQDIFPDSKLRNRALRETRKFLPKADESWQFGFSRSNRDRELRLTSKVIDCIDNWLTQDIPEDAVMTVTGELIRIDFDKRLVVLRYPPTHQEIECIYLEELEDSMIENRRQMIQVTGQFTLDADGHPTKLTDVTRIELVDLSPINIREVSGNDKKLRLKMPLFLIPEMDEETRQLLVVEEPQIGLHVFAYTRDELIYEINEQILMMWDEYVNISVDELALDARQLREALLEKIEEVENAPAEN